MSNIHYRKSIAWFEMAYKHLRICIYMEMYVHIVSRRVYNNR